MYKSCFALAVSTCLLFSAVSGTAQQGATNFSASNSSQVVNIQQNSSGFALKAFTNSSSPVGAIFGQASAPSGYTNGVWGRNYSAAGVGVRGEAMYASTGNTSNPTGVAGFANYAYGGIGVYGHAQYNGYGVYGMIDSLDNVGAGVFGRAGGSCCGIPGLFEQDAAFTGGYNIILVGQYLNASNQLERAITIDSNEITGNSFLATNPYGGALFAGRSSPESSTNVFRVDPTGAVYADGGYHTGGADFAESFSAKATNSGYTAGDVLIIDQTATRQLARSSHPYSTLVAGIYSTKPGVLASPYTMDQTPKSDIPLAVVGVVPCKVTTANGAIHPGDLLVTSAKPGYAMKGTDKNKMVGALLGKALEPLTKGDGVIQVLVSLQ